MSNADSRTNSHRARRQRDRTTRFLDSRNQVVQFDCTGGCYEEVVDLSYRHRNEIVVRRDDASVGAPIGFSSIQ